MERYEPALSPGEDVGVGAGDVVRSADVVVGVLSAGLDRDWGLRAGDLDWTCRRTLDHIVDALLLYANHLATRSTECRRRSAGTAT